ncbi:MAG TPA: cation transporter [Chlorobiota bacterium]|nr:cation transporter [Chlorobiota bacterium]
MNTGIRLFIGLLLMLPMTAIAVEQTVTLNVNGRCGSCKKRIEKAAGSVQGVKEASWDKKKKVLKAVYDDAKTNTDAITTAILSVGYDVDTLKGSQEAYDKLPECCQYREE